MKYFNNYPYTAETLKAEFRALCLTMHPDRGGNAEEFKAMTNEYEEVTNNLQRINEEAEAREEMKRAAEEARRRREQEEREEEARKAAARPEYERKCNKWAHLMEDLNPYKQAEADARKLHGWSSQEAKAAGSAYRAARRRNLVAMAKAAFPGVKFSASINTGWGGGATISWHEGPTVEEFKAATDYEIFVSGWDTFDGMTDCAGYERADFTEFANNYGDFSGCVSYERTEDKEHREEVADIICSVKPSAAEQRARDGRREDCTVFLSDEEIVKICSLLGIDADKFKKAHSIYGTWGESKYFELFVEWFTKWSHYTPQPKAPEFVPKYGKTYKAIKKALGGNVFGIRKTSEIRDIFALCDDLTGLEIGKIFVWDGKKEFSGMYSSSRKNTAARIEKMQSVGITLDRAGESVQAVSDEVREALRRERQDIERQRQEWEAEQRGEKKAEKPAEKAEKPRKERKPTESKQDSQKPATANESNADGLTMEQYSEKATVIRGYNAEQAAELEAMGGKEWRNLRGGKGYIFSTRRHGDELAEWMKQQQGEGTAAPAADEPTATTLEQPADITDTTSEPTATAQDEPQTAQSEPTADEPQADQPANLSPVLQAFADVLRIFADIMQQAKQWEGVTIPAATLARWKQESEDGTKTAAARLCEVCACLASLTPDSRRDFDALGAIFWSLSEQIRNGYDPATIQTATDYARAQLFDLIDRTQTENQARAVREANEPNSEQRKAA